MKRRKYSREIEFSDIDLYRWKEYDFVLTDTWWDLGRRASGNGHSLEYYGTFVPQIATQTFLRFTKRDDIVVDWFLGSGTSAIEAVNLDRRLIGVELVPELVEHVSGRVREAVVAGRIEVICADSTTDDARTRVQAALERMDAEYAQLAVLHPPYADIIKFSNLDADLSNCASTDDFVRRFGMAASNAYETLQPGRFAVLVIGDKYAKGELDPLGFRCMQEMTGAGFKLKSIVVKNIEGNEVGKGKNNNLWRYRALKGGFYVFKHEYVMVFRKPADGST